MFLQTDRQTDKIRILIVTDSLGCPRDETYVYDTWTEKVLKSFDYSKVIVYTYCKYGLSFKDIPIEYIKHLKPNIIIFQIGIVDAARRVVSRKLEEIISRIPVISRVARIVFSKYHYQLTRLYNCHYAYPDRIEKTIKNIIEICSADLFFIQIAPASKTMCDKSYNLKYEIKRYNDILYKSETFYNHRVKVINPYMNIVYDFDSIFIGDGHHLNKKGNSLVYKTVISKLEKFIIDYEV